MESLDMGPRCSLVGRRGSVCSGRRTLSSQIAELRSAGRTNASAPTQAYRPFDAIRLIRSRTRQEYPHSLSYHEITLTQLPPTTRVMGASTMEERESPLKSDETSSFSSNPR